MHTSFVQRELPVYHHIARRMAESSHQGRSNIRRLLDSFEVTSPHGKHIILVFEPAQMSLRDMRLAFRQDGFDENFVRGAIIELLKALDFLHTHGEVVHTGIAPLPIFIRHSFADVLRMCTLETCFWESTLTTICKSLRKGNSHLLYLANWSHPIGLFISRVSCGPMKVHCCYPTLARLGSAQDHTAVT